MHHVFETEIGYFEGRAEGLLSALAGGVPEAAAVFRRHVPQLGAARPTIADARLAIARQHGFETWDAFRAHVESLRDGGEEPFLRAMTALRADDGDALAALVDRHPWLVTARGTNGNDLVGLATAMCRVAIVRRLLALGADPAGANDRGWTALHQAAYLNHEDLTRVLLAAGAPTGGSGHGDGGTPLVAALFWGHREAAELIAEHDLAPGNLRVAAGLGRPDLVTGLVGPDGRLAPAAGAHRSFYRPHTGFPLWQPSDDRQEILDEALTWAARSGRTSVMGTLVERGAGIDADPYRGTALAWAASNGRVEAATWLLDHGADGDRRGTFGGPRHGGGVTALHLAAESGHEAVVRLLLERGADPSIEEEVYGATPLGWAEHNGQHDVAAILRAAGR